MMRSLLALLTLVIGRLPVYQQAMALSLLRWAWEDGCANIGHNPASCLVSEYSRGNLLGQHVDFRYPWAWKAGRLANALMNPLVHENDRFSARTLHRTFILPTRMSAVQVTRAEKPCPSNLLRDYQG